MIIPVLGGEDYNDYQIVVTLTVIDCDHPNTELKDVREGNNIVVKQKINVNDLFREKYGTTYKKFVVSPKGIAKVNGKGILTAKWCRIYISCWH